MLALVEAIVVEFGQLDVMVNCITFLVGNGHSVTGEVLRADAGWTAFAWGSDGNGNCDVASQSNRAQVPEAAGSDVMILIGTTRYPERAS